MTSPSYSRLKEFKKKLANHAVDAFFVSCEPNVSYLSGYTGTESFLRRFAFGLGRQPAYSFCVFSEQPSTAKCAPFLT